MNVVEMLWSRWTAEVQHMTFTLLSQESNPSQPTLPKSIPRARLSAIAHATIVRWAWTSADKHEPIGKCASVLSWPSATSPRRLPNFSTISAKAATRSQVRDGAPLRSVLRDFEWTNARSRIQPRPGRFLGSTSLQEGVVPINMDFQERRARF